MLIGVRRLVGVSVLELVMVRLAGDLFVGFRIVISFEVGKNLF